MPNKFWVHCQDVTRRTAVGNHRCTVSDNEGQGLAAVINTLANVMPNREILLDWACGDFVTGENHVKQSEGQVVAIVMMLQIVNSPA